MIVEWILVFFTGLLAGEELVVRYGVHPALSSLDGLTHLRARQALIRPLMVYVPVMLLLVTVSTVLALVLAGNGWHWGGAVALLGFMAATFGGTVPINQRVNDWDATAPPADWHAVIDRWARVDVLRSSLAVVTFALQVVAAAV
jgi:hypothetical protein